MPAGGAIAGGDPQSPTFGQEQGTCSSPDSPWCERGVACVIAV
jgi:hypothetical protein